MAAFPSQISKTTTLPRIEFSPFLDPNSTLETKKKIALQIDKACRDIGFFYLSHEGISPNLMKSMLQNTQLFFETASVEEKEGIRVKKAGEGVGDDARGWHKFHGRKGAHECVDMFRPVDTSQGPPYEVGLGENQWPSTPPSFREVSERYIDEMVLLGTGVIRAVAMGLKVEERLLLERIDKPFWNLRILGYEGCKSDRKIEEVKGMGEHTDFGILTFLLTDEQKGSLQIRLKNGEWISADPIPGYLLCNIGAMLSKWTGGQYVATRHRVRHDSDKMRVSIPFFFDPNMDTLISPVLPGCEDTGKDKAILYREKFVQCVQYSITQ